MFPSGSRVSRSPRPALMSISSISAEECYLKGSRLNLRVPVKRVGSYAMTVIFCRTRERLIVEMSIPSILIEPLQSSIIRERASEIVDLPAPVLPTTPTFVPGITMKESSFSTISVFGLYFSYTLSKSIRPLFGQLSSSGSG